MSASAFDMEFNRLKSEVVGLRKQIGAMLDVVKDPSQVRGRRFYRRLYKRAQQAGETARDQAGQAYGFIDKKMKKRPWTGGLIMFGTGILVGALLDHRYRH